MRIGLYGSIANAGFSLAHALRRRGYQAEYVHEPTDRYPLSQPFWEEVELTVDPRRLPDDLPTDAQWRLIAEEHGWRRPPWIVDADLSADGAFSMRQWLRAARLLARAPGRRPELRSHLSARGGHVRTFGRYDWLIVSGIGVIDAYLSARPYLYWPNGGELRLLPFRHETPHERFVAVAMRAAVASATVTGTHDPTLADCFRSLGARQVPFLPFLIDTDRYAPVPDAPRTEFGRELLRRAAGRPILLLAARQDVRWKATDQFARAFVRAVGEGASFLLAICPWGNDGPAIRALLEEGASDSIVYLDTVPSKPLLIELYTLSDVVVDQFALGVHGSTMLEAMACGTPVLIWFDADLYRSRWPRYVPPPVISVSGEEEILDALRRLNSGALDAAALGATGRSWVVEHHGIAQADRYVPRRTR